MSTQAKAVSPGAYPELIRELMARYNEKRAEWVARFGSDEGFNAWFTKQVGL